MSTDHDVLAAAADLVAAFGSGDLAAYFSHFDPEATFVFHTTAGRLESRQAYEQLWAQWQREDGLRVLGCRSSNQRVQEFTTVAVFTHDVETTVSTPTGEETVYERETIVFRRTESGWRAVHEHLSADPRFH